MTRRNTWAIIAVAAALSLPLAACKDAKTEQENQQLKAQVTQLQKENGQAVNDLESMTADRDALKKENDQLTSEIKALKGKGSKKKASRKHHRSQV
jgi:peptidoglycan hydrolase CwlO-like protein